MIGHYESNVFGNHLHFLDHLTSLPSTAVTPLYHLTSLSDLHILNGKFHVQYLRHKILILYVPTYK